MRRLGILTCGVLALALLGGCQSSGPLPWCSVVAPEELAKASLQYYWRTQLVLDCGETLKNLWQVDQDLYAVTSRNRLIAIDGLTGNPRWTLCVINPAQQVFPPCHAEDISLPQSTGMKELTEPDQIPRLKPFNAVIFNTLSYALVIDRASGQVRRQLNFDFPANAGGATDGTYFYVPSINGYYYSIRLSEGLVEWVMSGDDLITARPVYFEKRLYVATHKGTFLCVAPEAAVANRHLWTQKTDGPITSDFVVETRGCFVPSQDSRLHAFDLNSGEKLWEYVTQGALRQATQVSERSVFQYADCDRFYALDLASGRKRWDSCAAWLVLASFGNDIAALTADRRLLVMDEMTGEASYSVPMTGLTIFVPNARHPALFAASADGKVVCIRKAKSGALKGGMLGASAASQPASQPTSAPTSAPAAAPAAAPGAIPEGTPPAPTDITPAQTPPPTIQ